MDKNSASDLPSRPLASLLLGALILFFDGFDLAVYGVIAPVLQSYERWGMTPALVGAIGSLAPLGMIPGAMLGGYCADAYGRRGATLICLFLVSAAMLLSFLAPSLWIFMLARLLTGMAVGALTPLALAIVSEHAPRRNHTLFIAVAMSGLSLGGIVANGLGGVILKIAPFQYLFLFGLLPLLLIPVGALVLSDARRPAAVEAKPGAPATDGRRFRQLFRPPCRATTIGLGIANIFALALFYGVSVWLPTLFVNSSLYTVQSALGFGAIFFTGALAGQLIVAAAADRLSVKPFIAVSFAAILIALAVLSAPRSIPVTLFTVGILGMGVIGTGTLINAYVASFYPAHLRGSGLGLLTAAGRAGAIAGPIYLGYVISLSGAPGTGFHALMALALVGTIIALLQWRPWSGKAGGKNDPHPAPEGAPLV